MKGSRRSPFLLRPRLAAFLLLAALVLPGLSLVADSEPLRLGELAGRLAVEASHVTRQVQQLERTGYLTRVPDPDDRRAQRCDVGRQSLHERGGNEAGARPTRRELG